LSCDKAALSSASVEELLGLAEAWDAWGDDPGAFFAFAWCRVLAWP